MTASVIHIILLSFNTKSKAQMDAFVLIQTMQFITCIQRLGSWPADTITDTKQSFHLYLNLPHSLFDFNSSVVSSGMLKL